MVGMAMGAPRRALQRVWRAFTRQAHGKAQQRPTQRAQPHVFEADPVFPPHSEEELRSMRLRNLLAGVFLVGGAGLSYYGALHRRDPILTAAPNVEFSNWSGTHAVTAHRLYEPRSSEEVASILALAHRTGQRVRVVGSALSPNGMALGREGMLSLAHMDGVLSVDETERTVTVQAGVRVAELSTVLRQHGLALANYASIREQTVGGFTQAGAHGTGAGLPPVEGQVLALRLVTPAAGVLDLSPDRDPELFGLAVTGLGCLGVVTELKLRCVPAHRLVETTSVESARQVRAAHADRLARSRHLRYMWIPHTDAVVVVQAQPYGDVPGLEHDAKAPDADAASSPGRIQPSKYTAHQQTAPLRALGVAAGVLREEDDASATSLADLRDAMLAAAPLDVSWVKRVNAAEAECWRRAVGQRVGWSDEILGFDCGGQQWVSELCFAAGPPATTPGRDLEYVSEVLSLIRRHGIPAPAPIEQRWTAASPACMSPAAGGPGQVFSWVGIIQYLPHDDEDKRAAITASFEKYRTLVADKVGLKYDAVEHWAKMEPPSDPDRLEALRQRLAHRYPLAAFHAARRRLDPNNILGNDWVDALLPLSPPLPSTLAGEGVEKAMATVKKAEAADVMEGEIQTQ